MPAYSALFRFGCASVRNLARSPRTYSPPSMVALVRAKHTVLKALKAVAELKRELEHVREGRFLQ